jgi:ectoine hydroxylase
MIAVDKATRENGCLQVLRGSQRMGRVDHVRCGDQTGADPERVQAACARMELVHVELDPGDAVIFHGNLLHRSDQNRSQDPRWAFICCYNTRSNSPIREGRHPLYTPLQRLSDDAVRTVGKQHLQRLLDAESRTPGILK